jgi:Trk-type K+ transport system membrane component
MIEIGAPKAKRKKPRKTWLFEFSKRVVITVTVLYVLAMIYACVLIWLNPDSTAADTLVSNISDIFKATVVSYAVKAGFENVVKIHKDEPDAECDWREN